VIVDSTHGMPQIGLSQSGTRPHWKPPVPPTQPTIACACGYGSVEPGHDRIVGCGSRRPGRAGPGSTVEVVVRRVGRSCRCAIAAAPVVHRAASRFDPRVAGRRSTSACCVSVPIPSLDPGASWCVTRVLPCARIRRRSSHSRPSLAQFDPDRCETHALLSRTLYVFVSLDWATELRQPSLQRDVTTAALLDCLEPVRGARVVVASHQRRVITPTIFGVHGPVLCPRELEGTRRLPHLHVHTVTSGLSSRIHRFGLRVTTTLTGRR